METQGLVVPEAMAMEKPVIFSNLGPGTETIVPYETGLLCNPHDPNDIAEKILWVFKNETEASFLGKKARKAALEKFDPDEKINENINFYNTVITLK
jgi:glycosyltransferase involved in cell wall biosynthesis